MKRLTATFAAAVTAAGLSFFAQGSSAAPLGAGLTGAPRAAETLVDPVQWGPGYGYERRRVYRDYEPRYERRRVYRDYDPRFDRRRGGYGPSHSRGYGNAYGRRNFDSGYQGRPGVVFGPGGRGGERCFLDGAGRKVCR